DAAVVGPRPCRGRGRRAASRRRTAAAGPDRRGGRAGRGADPGHARPAFRPGGLPAAAALPTAGRVRRDHRRLAGAGAARRPLGATPEPPAHKGSEAGQRVPYWLIATRDPAGLAAAITSARASATVDEPRVG